MRLLKSAVPVALAVGAVAAAPAGAETPPKAKAAGDPVVELTYPSIVQTRVARTERALERATKRIENGQIADAATTLKVVRRQMAASWRGAKYVIRTTPAPPPPEDLARRAKAKAKAKAAGDPVVGPTYAGPAETAYRVLTLQHDVSTSMVALIDGSHGTGLAALSTTINLANDRRDSALDYILAVQPPPPPPEDLARASQDDPVGPPGFDVIMPTLAPQIDDELQALEGTKADATDLTAGGRRLLNAASTQVEATKAFVALHWPVVVPED